MILQMLKLGTIVTDSITELKGMLTHAMVKIGGDVEYIFQPKKLDDQGMPVDKIFVTAQRVQEGEYQYVDVPVQYLGTMGTDEGTGYKGKIAWLIYHLDGCLHVAIQPKGSIKEIEFDIRRVKGPAIKPLTPKKLEESIKKTPSPMSYKRRIAN